MRSVALRQNQALHSRPAPQPVNREAYRYISGQVKALELNLLDQSRLSRLLDARDVDDISRILTECGYPSGDHPEAMLRAESIGVITWLQQQLPDPLLAAVLIVFHDGHNLKLVLKKLLSTWMSGRSGDDLPGPGRASSDESDESGQALTGSLPDFGATNGIPPFGASLTLAQLPAEVAPGTLYLCVAEHRTEDLPEWLGQTATAAVQCYLQRYDLGDVDLFIDQAAWRQAHALAAQASLPFLQSWLRRKTDLINLELLLRTRMLRSGRDTLSRALLPGGHPSTTAVLALYGESDEAIKAVYADTPYAPLAELGRTYEKSGQAAHFGRMADHLLMEQIRTARWIIQGPEVPLAWVLARQAEIKNIRIILTCLRNGLPQSLAQNLIRDGYLSWR